MNVCVYFFIYPQHNLNFVEDQCDATLSLVGAIFFFYSRVGKLKKSNRQQQIHISLKDDRIKGLVHAYFTLTLTLFQPVLVQTVTE